MDENVDLKKELNRYICEYARKYGSDGAKQIIKDIKHKNKSNYLSDYLNSYEVDELYDALHEIIESRHKRKQKKMALEITSGALAILIAISACGFVLNRKKSGKKSGNQVVIELPQQEYFDESVAEEIFKYCQENNLINTFEKCETLESIEKRKEELKSLSFSDDDKIYKECPLSAELQHFIYEQSIENNVPFDFIMSIIHVETRGQFNSSGVVGVNTNGTHDLGLTQQNTSGTLPIFIEKYNLEYNDAYNLVKDDDYANVCCAFLNYQEIDKRHDSFDPYEYAGCYNGWVLWKNYDVSREYVSLFTEAYDTIYTEHHMVEKEKSSENGVKSSKK